MSPEMVAGRQLLQLMLTTDTDLYNKGAFPVTQPVGVRATI